jgi:hypothetical protein
MHDDDDHEDLFTRVAQMRVNREDSVPQGLDGGEQ